MSRRDKILAQYEETLFTLLMSEAAEWEGGRLLEEMERLSRDPAAACAASLLFTAAFGGGADLCREAAH